MPCYDFNIMLKRIGILLAVVAVVVIFMQYVNRSVDEQKAHGVHYHAGFRVYVDGALQDYTDAKFMNFTPCSEHDVQLTKEQEQMELAHLHDFVGDVVHSHRSGATWGDLFKNINVDLPKDKSLTGYINGIENEDIMNTPIKAYTTAIFIVGSDDSGHGQEIVSEEHIRQVETKSELCGTN
jgi:hypothetical protein